MANEYQTVDQLKTWLSIPIEDLRDDDNLTVALTAASREVDRICNRRFYLDAVATARTYRAASDALHVFTDDFATTSGLVISTGTQGAYTTTLASDEYELLGGIEGQPYNGFLAVDYLPTDGYRKTVQVTAKWGWSDVPAEVEQATLILASRLFMRKDAVQGILGFGTADLGGVRLGSNDPDVAALLSPYMKVVWA